MVLVTPMAMSSWLGLILYPLRRPNAILEHKQALENLRMVARTLRDRDVLKEQNNCGHREFGGKSRK